MRGTIYEILSDVIKALTNIKIFMSGSYSSSMNQKFVRCAYKAQDGHIYPLETSLFFLQKPIIQIAYQSIKSIEFLRLESSLIDTKMFDLMIVQKSTHKENYFQRKEISYTFTGIPKEEFNKLFEFFDQKEILIKNRGQHVNRMSSSAKNKRQKFDINAMNNKINSILGDVSSQYSSSEENYVKSEISESESSVSEKLDEDPKLEEIDQKSRSSDEMNENK